MKKRLKYFLLGIIAVVVTYINFSYFLWDINPNHWDDESIGFFIVLASSEILLGCIASLLLGDENDERTI